MPLLEAVAKSSSKLTFKYAIDQQWVRLEYYVDENHGIHVKTIPKIKSRGVTPCPP